MVHRAAAPGAGSEGSDRPVVTRAQSGHERSEHHRYDGTSPATTLLWVIAMALVLLCWLAYAYLHTVGPDQFPQTSSIAHQRVAFADGRVVGLAEPRRSETAVR